MSRQVIEIYPADLSAIENNLGRIHKNISALNSDVGAVNDNVRIVYDEVEKLAGEFRDYVDLQIKSTRLQLAESRLIKIRQELEKKYGHYDIVRRTTTGILQATDLGIVKRETISNATEEMMLSTPRYWLAPCLIALAAWINDQPELAERAVREGIRRNDEKTSLFFALICRRADRKQASLKWTQRYLANQNEEDLDRKTIIILDAFASGLLGADSEGVISRQMGDWLEHLTEKPGFIEQQIQQWSESINLKRKPIFFQSAYPYLKKYSKTWPQLRDILEGANLHATILDYFMGIFDQEASTDTLKAQLDDILNNLVSDFDDEELPLRKEERFEQLIVDFDGDETRAKQNMLVEESAFETHKDFTQLLTDAAMKPETSHASISTQKFAIALSRDWIHTAYSDITAQNRAKIPNEIEINVDSFNDKTTDGQNEVELVGRFNSLIDQEKEEAMAQTGLTGFQSFCMFGGAAIAGVGLLLILVGLFLESESIISIFLGLIAAISGSALIMNYSSAKKKVEQARQEITEQYEKKRDGGTKIIRATLAEVVDFRSEFSQKDAEGQKVLDFLEQITPDQYVRKLSDSGRRIRM